MTTQRAVQYIVCTGNVIVGNRFFGPFLTTEEATAWGDENFEDSGYIVAQVNVPLIQPTPKAWRADAPINPAFRGAERPRVGEDY